MAAAYRDIGLIAAGTIAAEAASGGKSPANGGRVSMVCRLRGRLHAQHSLGPKLASKIA
jgi:hypothetical protein